ncbi:MAG: hypothetical protein Q8S33_12515 [Myxococcales bacterium]|nr:hypothetical protein [Myxococcales bacterium]
MTHRLLSLTLLTLSCTHVRAKDSTVAEHQNEAAIHQARAREERAKFDPTEVRRVPPRSPIMLGPETGAGAIAESYNPTSGHLAAADRELREANAHLAAAKTLTTFENEACAGLSEGERSSCPLLASSVSRVQSTKRGFVMTLKPEVDPQQTYRMLSCHLAYAVASGFDRPSCPLFLEGTMLARVGDDGIGFVGDTDAVAVALRASARRVFTGYQAAASP